MNIEEEIGTKLGTITLDGKVIDSKYIDNNDDFPEELSIAIGQAVDTRELFFTGELEDIDIDEFDSETITFLTNLIVDNKFTEPQRALALTMLYDIPLIDITENDIDRFSANGGEYLVLGDEEADKTAYEYSENLFDDIGFEGFSEFAQQYAIDNFLETSWLDTTMEDSNYSYMNDIETEEASDDSYINRLHEEMVESEIMTAPEWPEESEFEDDEEYEEARSVYESDIETEIDDKKEEFIEYLNNQYSDAVEWYKTSFGEDQLSELIKQDGDLLDKTAFLEWVIETDGRGQILNGYDGNEDNVEIDYDGETYDLYVYRQS